MKGRIHSIETLGLLDGPGIRTIFFLQGCPLRCSYCHNPDTQQIVGGNEMTSDEIVQTAKRYLPYYRHSGGGVTFSGGEPLLQGDFLLETSKGGRDSYGFRYQRIWSGEILRRNIGTGGCCTLGYQAF